MNNVDFDPMMFDKDEYGNLIRNTESICPFCGNGLLHDEDGFFCECGWREEDVV